MQKSSIQNLDAGMTSHRDEIENINSHVARLFKQDRFETAVDGPKQNVVWYVFFLRTVLSTLPCCRVFICTQAHDRKFTARESRAASTSRNSCGTHIEHAKSNNQIGG